MAPTKPPSKSKTSRSKPTSSTATSKPRTTSSKTRFTTKLPLHKTNQQKTRRPGSGAPPAPRHATPRKKPTRRTLSAEELGIAPLNTIVPAGVHKPTGKGAGKRRGKVFVDDAETQLAILSLVNAEVDGVVEGKVGKARKLEELRQARQHEGERREEGRRGALEDKKDEIRRQKRRRGGKGVGESADVAAPVEGAGKGENSKRRKRVSFA
ncbi:MAG: 60S ribosomal subunit assembly/export protein [Piccolia ochrophora]|nr:MAG: 60S ribosomal subunit assembly/export protein [Piccolia ochrophora]